jgi:hypothetical protein
VLALLPVFVLPRPVELWLVLALLLVHSLVLVQQLVPIVLLLQAH